MRQKANLKRGDTILKTESKENLQKAQLSLYYFRRVLKLLNSAGKVYIFPIVFFGLVASIIPSASVRIMQEVVNSLQLSTKDLGNLLKLLLAYIALDIIQSIFSVVSGYFERRLQMNGSLAVQMSILEKVKEFSLKDFEDSETYDLLQRAMKVNFARIWGFFRSFLLLAQSLINIVLFSLILFSWKWWLVPLILIVPIINTCFNAYFGKKQFLIIKERSAKERKAWYFQYLLTRDTAFKEIKLFDLGDHLREKFRELHLGFISQDKKLLDQRTTANSLLIVLEEAISIFILGFIILQAFARQILLGDLTTYLRSISSVKSYAQSFLSQITAIYENVLYIGQYFEFLDKECISEVPAVGAAPPQEGSCLIPSIEIRDLSYRYKSQPNYALRHINLKIAGGSLVAFIGVNGSGKSTLVKILSTLYQDYEGGIYFGGRELSSLQRDEVRKKIGILFQDFVRYELSARENIAFGSLSKMDDSADIQEILQNVGLKKRISDLDMQLGVWFDEGGQLSGGEWLKIALGRAFIRDAELYLLDEPNAALDSISERVILRSFQELVKGKIGIIVSHRIASIKDIVDRIVVFHNGVIDAAGTHNELLETSAVYREMFYNESAEDDAELTVEE